MIIWIRYSGLRVEDLGPRGRIYGSGFRVEDIGPRGRALGLGFRV
jgi:hypothetical protein